MSGRRERIDNNLNEENYADNINATVNEEAENKHKKKKKKNPLKVANGQIMNITYIFLLLFLCMLAYLVKFELVDSDEVINNSYNKRENILAKTVVRGNILSRDGDVLAETLTDDDGNEYRNYPYGSLFAHAVGYSTHGKAGVELEANYKLLTSNVPIIEYAENQLLGNKNQGNNVVTTLSVELTKAASSALGSNDGAVIAMDPETGEILTMVSQPDFDPNTIADNYSSLIEDEDSSNLLNRTTSGLYTPGSTFKLFTMYEYLKENGSFDDYSYQCDGTIYIDDNSMSCAGKKSHGYVDMPGSFAYSCNCSFVNLGLTLDKNKLKKTCEKLYFNSKLPLDFGYKKSQFVLDGDSSEFETMQTVIGQGKTLVTPIHLCMIASALANDGVLEKPFIIKNVQNAYGKTIREYSSETVKRLFSKADTKKLTQCMREVVTYGTATVLNTDSYEAYGKTGTAQLNTESGEYNSLFMGFAECNGKKIAICVVLEDMPEGSTSAVPVAKAVFDQYFS